ncbi:LacI family DNA-binding transcriptional regulator [Salipaludibacillus sp. HK11]|uniref:LacI family DNA-binding transcriptional regulator n=1 Tax=Salipaludibacillus sp. HK11 TaxID=3394320 RepID=UPI0039FC36DD
MKLTIKEIAKIAGLAPSTVSKIINNYDDINEETKKRVLKIMEEHHYRPSYSAKSLASKSTNVIGVIYAGKVNAGFNHPFFIDVLDAFKKTIGKKGYDLLFFSNEKFHEGKEDYLERCVHYGVDGCVVISGEEVEPSITHLDASSVPSVGIDLELTGVTSSYVMTNHKKISQLVVKHLYDLNYRKIAFIGSEDTSIISRQRKEGFLESMKNYQLSIVEEWIMIGDFFETSGYDHVKRLIEVGRVPEAIFASSDLMAIGAMEAIRDSKLDVSEFAIVGVDDIPAAQYIAPSLTTIRQDKELLGRSLAEKLCLLISSGEKQKPIYLDPELVVRNSTKRKKIE